MAILDEQELHQNISLMSTGTSTLTTTTSHKNDSDNINSASENEEHPSSPQNLIARFFELPSENLEEGFVIHRKLLRRRHVRKEQNRRERMKRKSEAVARAVESRERMSVITNHNDSGVFTTILCSKPGANSEECIAIHSTPSGDDEGSLCMPWSFSPARSTKRRKVD